MLIYFEVVEPIVWPLRARPGHIVAYLTDIINGRSVRGVYLYRLTDGEAEIIARDYWTGEFTTNVGRLAELERSGAIRPMPFTADLWKGYSAGLLEDSDPEPWSPKAELRMERPSLCLVR